MLWLLLLLTAQAGDRTEAAARAILQEQGFAVTDLAPLPDQKGWFEFTATRLGARCTGTVEVQKKGRKPRGRFAAACEDVPPTPE